MFSRGTHQGTLQSDLRSQSEKHCSNIYIVVVEDESHALLGIVSDMSLVNWFMTNVRCAFSYRSTSTHSRTQAGTHPGLASVLIAPLTTLPGIYQHPVISCASDDTLLDGMRLLSEQGVSSIAVVDPVGMLLSAISVRDIGRRVVPSPNKRILDMSLANFITLIKAEDGATDGVDKFPGMCSSACLAGFVSSFTFSLQRSPELDPFLYDAEASRHERPPRLPHG